MAWLVVVHEDLDAEIAAFPRSVRKELLAQTKLLQQIGPHLGRPHVDTLRGSTFKNMKELRFDADGGVWRVAFAFDPHRSAVLLVAADKQGIGQRRFYETLIAKADARFSSHLRHLAIDGGKEE